MSIIEWTKHQPIDARAHGSRLAFGRLDTNIDIISIFTHRSKRALSNHHRYRFNIDVPIGFTMSYIQYTLYGIAPDDIILTAFTNIVSASCYN